MIHCYFSRLLVMELARILLAEISARFFEQLPRAASLACGA